MLCNNTTFSLKQMEDIIKRTCDLEMFLCIVLEGILRTFPTYKTAPEFLDRLSVPKFTNTSGECFCKIKD